MIIDHMKGINDADWRRFSRAITDYGRDNLVKINAYISKPFATEYITDIVISNTTLLSNMGGLLGLCMGFSVVSLAELLHCAISIISEYTKRFCQTSPGLIGRQVSLRIN